MFYRISVEGKWGFIDACGSIVIEPQFLGANDFSEGLAKVEVPGLTEEARACEYAASGFIDERGEFVIGPGSPPGYKFPRIHSTYTYGDFHDGMARFWVGDATGLGGYIDRTGTLVIPPQYAHTWDFSEGLACVSTPRKDGSPFGPKLTGFIDSNGRSVIAFNRSFIATGFSEGLSVVEVEQDGKWQPSVINRKGKTVVPIDLYTGIGDFVGGLSRVVQNGKVGCINSHGKVVIPIEFDQLHEFGNGDLTTAVKQGRTCIVDRTGQCVTEISLGIDFDIGPIRSGFAKIKSENKVGYVDTSGELAIPLQFDRGDNFVGELASVEIAGETSYVNKRGDVVWTTDCWDTPIRNAVMSPLADFLPPGTIEALPLEYNWQRVENAIVFVSNARFRSVGIWLSKTLDPHFELDSMDDVIHVDFSRDELTGSFHAVKARSDELEGFINFYASKNMKLLFEKHRPVVVGILLQDRTWRGK